jgi:hypothetical protein
MSGKSEPMFIIVNDQTYEIYYARTRINAGNFHGVSRDPMTEDLVCKALRSRGGHCMSERKEKNPK